MCRLCERPNVLFPLSKDEGLSLLLHITGLVKKDDTYCSKFSNVRITAIDIESYMRDHDMITELGAAFCNTTEMLPSPGAYAGNWISKINSHHIRIEEYGHKINRLIRNGHNLFAGDKFGFGRTEWTSIRDLGTVTTSLLRAATTLSVKGEEPQYQKMVLIGHAVDNEFEYMRKIGIDLQQLGSVIAVLDTQIIAGPFHGHKISLSNLISGFGIEPLGLHNAGNDATYTLISALRLALREASSRGVTLPNPAESGVVAPNAPVELLRKVARDKLGSDSEYSERCNYCGGRNHQQKDCGRAAYCDICNVVGHSTDRCRKCPKCDQWASHGNDCPMTGIRYPHRSLQDSRKHRGPGSNGRGAIPRTRSNGNHTTITSNINSVADFPPISSQLPAYTTQIFNLGTVVQNDRTINMHTAPYRPSPSYESGPPSGEAASTTDPAVPQVTRDTKPLSFAEIVRRNARR